MTVTSLMGKVVFSASPRSLSTENGGFCTHSPTASKSGLNKKINCNKGG